MRWTYEELAGAELTKYEELLRHNPGPAFTSLVGWEFRGWNVPTHPIAKIVVPLAGFQRFVKLFFRRAGDPEPARAPMIHGCNKMITKGGLDQPWDDKLKRGEPKRHGFYKVYRAGDGPKRFGPYGQSVFLDYSVAENGLFDGGKVLFDFLVEVSEDLMLGKAYVCLPGIRLHVSYFILERLGKHTFIR